MNHPHPAWPEFTHAFQPIVDTRTRTVRSFEALIRGKAGESAGQVLQEVPAADKYRFDEASRMAAVALAAKLGLRHHLNLNFLPQGLYASETAINSMLGAARQHGIPVESLVLEVTEDEMVGDLGHFARQLQQYRRHGLKVAIDDFGTGYSGLNLLAEFQPDQVKIDMKLVRGIERHGPRQSIVRAVAQVCADLGIDVIAEGVETGLEYRWFEDHGITMFQGCFFAEPQPGRFAEVQWPAATNRRHALPMASPLREGIWADPASNAGSRMWTDIRMPANESLVTRSGTRCPDRGPHRFE